ncbi:MAG: T9SS type A sorting domain-containing protein [Bacteroidota bacterium]
MKKIAIVFLLICCWGINGFAQNGFGSTMSVSFTIPDVNGTFGPNDQIEVDYQPFNNTQENLTINSQFELWDANGVIYEMEPDPELIPSESSDAGTIRFSLPADCLLSSGIYELHMNVTYEQSATTAPATVSTFDNNFNIICDNLTIPVGNPGVSEVCEVFIADLLYVDLEENCCTFDPTITLTAIPNNASNPHKFPTLRTYVSAHIDFNQVGDPVAYTLEWSHGATGHSFIHDCGGTVEYYLTVTWQENGHVCTKTAGPIEANAISDCNHSGDPSGPGGPGGGDGDSPPPPVQTTPENTTVAPLQLFPNPSQGHFQLILPSDKSVVQVEVWNNLGQKVWHLERPQSGHYPLDFSAFQSGLYHLRVQYDNRETVVQQVIIQ